MESARRAEHRVRCANLFLAVGALGTSSILLRNRVNLPGLGRALGTRFSGNGDLLTFAMGARADGPTGPSRLIDGSYGPVITTAIRVADGADGGNGRGYYVQEAGFPEFANWIIETTQVTASVERGSKTIWELLKHRLGSRDQSTISAEVSRLIGEGRLGTAPCHCWAWVATCQTGESRFGTVNWTSTGRRQPLCHSSRR